MARINTNVPSIIAQFNLGRSNIELEDTLQRLATGLRINRGADDPAGLIISERIGTDINGIEQAIRNGERASSVIATTEAALAEVNDLLNSIKALIVEGANSGGNSAEERAANQLQIDSALASITRISNTSTFGGLNLLDGSLDYITSGISSSAIGKARIFSASFVETNQLQVEVDVLASAQRGTLLLNANDPANGLFQTGTLQSATTLRVTGPRGVQEFTFPVSATIAQIAAGINQRTSLTGIESVVLNSGANASLAFRSSEYGSAAFVSVERIDTTGAAEPLSTLRFGDGVDFPDLAPLDFAALIADGSLVEAQRDAGRDVTALVNGTQANGDGLTISVNSTVLGLELELDETFGISPTSGASTFDIIGGGALFQIGPEVSALQQVNIGVQSVAASQLGGVQVNGGLQFLSSLATGQINSIETSLSRNDFSTASDILEAAIDEITVLRGRLGAFERNVLDTNRRSLQAAQENLTASRSLLTDADFAFETSRLTRAQILQSSGTTVLGLANTQSQSVLQLLG